jgi:hypothetical protein
VLGDGVEVVDLGLLVLQVGGSGVEKGFKDFDPALHPGDLLVGGFHVVCLEGARLPRRVAWSGWLRVGR